MRFSSFKTAQQVQSISQTMQDMLHLLNDLPFQQNFDQYSSTTHHSSNKLVNFSVMYIILNCKRSPSLIALTLAS